MNLARYINEDVIKLEMTTVVDEREETVPVDKWRQKSKELIIHELVDLLESGYRIGNRSKLVLDFINREKKATTGIGGGIAIPHIRTKQAKDFMIAFARSTAGYDFGSLDDKPAHMFFVMAAPPYDDALYLKVFKSLAEMLQYDGLREELMAAQSPGEVIRALRSAE
ncbi:MAG: PTS sugar transporter subunit IIA [Candidatus Zixiibacteriota bacterium]|nr:MAG: PTS sugar transporter subunit IIA [candidate division Zixibacteria bacterium]